MSGSHVLLFVLITRNVDKIFYANLYFISEGGVVKRGWVSYLLDKIIIAKIPDLNTYAVSSIL